MEKNTVHKGKGSRALEDEQGRGGKNISKRGKGVSWLEYEAGAVD